MSEVEELNNNIECKIADRKNGFYVKINTFDIHTDIPKILYEV